MNRRARDALLVIALLAVPVLVLRASSKAPADLNWLDRLVLRASAPVQGALTRAATFIGDGWHHYVWLVDLEAKNRGLVEENARLRADLDRARSEVERAAELERLLGLRAQVPSETIAARVVGIETSPFFRVARIRLDRGQGEVKPGMPVVVPAGIVGSVRRVFGRFCDVLLAIDPEASIDVVVARTGSQGTLHGVAGAYELRARVLREDEVREGDAVVTSGNDGVYPRDLRVGTVTAVTHPEAGLWKEAAIAPAVDFTRLEQVLVVLAPPPPPDPDARSDVRRASPPHRGLGTPR